MYLMPSNSSLFAVFANSLIMSANLLSIIILLALSLAEAGVLREQLRATRDTHCSKEDLNLSILFCKVVKRVSFLKAHRRQLQVDFAVAPAEIK